MDQKQLTPRQRDVVTEMCKGKSNKEIARTLGMAEATVKLHLTEIFRTLEVKNRASAIIKASDLPVTEVEPVPPLTDEDILREFTNTTFNTLNESWPDRVVKLGRAIEKRTRGIT